MKIIALLYHQIITLSHHRIHLRMNYFTVFLIVFFSTVSLSAQTLEEAKKLYLGGKYATALPAFETAVKSSPNNASYNQWYGTCLLETGKLSEAGKYLNFAASKNIIEAYNSLGKLYYLAYEFKESAAAYEKYTQLLIKNKKMPEADAVKPLKERSERAARMLLRCEDVQIIDSVILNKKTFLDAYFISQEAGSLENTENGVVYENPLKDSRYFAKKNKDGKYKLFNEIKLQNEWIDAKELSLPSDSLEDDNYPFVFPDGMTIYYASTGNGSIGGYDLFISRYNSNNNTYLAPAQMGMPFNSIANDYLMVVDENNEIGYFATDRFQPEDKIIVYTFIPNEEIQSIESDDEKELINRAKIVSVRDTWKVGIDYASVLREAKKNILAEKNKVKKDFFFVVNDNIVYYTLADFENEAAKQAFLKAKETETQIEETEHDLDTLRQDYAKGNKSFRQSLHATILSKENRVVELIEQHKKWESNARSLEIKQLRQK
jgi:hypothetical protein